MATRDAVSDLIRGNIDAIILCTLKDGDSYGYERISPSPAMVSTR